MAVKKVEKTVATKEKVAKPVKAAKTVKPKVAKPKAVKVAKETKKVVEKVVAKAPKTAVATPVKAKKETEKYFYAVGRRKTSVAQVRLFESDKATEADVMINNRKLKDYFPTIAQQNNLLAPLKAVGMQTRFRATVVVRGGGVTGQVEAIRLGIARALVKVDGDLKKSLKVLGFMTRDAREVERKKAGLKKARKAPQWAKR